MSDFELLDITDPAYQSLIQPFQHPPTPAHSSVTAILPQLSPDSRFWWDITSTLLALLLHKTQHPPDHQTTFLKVWSHIIDALGPRPLATLGPARFSPFSADQTPLEISWNTDGSTSSIRVSFDPAPTPADPVCQGVIRSLAESLSKLPGANIDMTVLDAVAEVMWVAPETAARLPNDPRMERPNHISMGMFVLPNGTFTLKGYITTQVKMFEVDGAVGEDSGNDMYLNNQSVQTTISRALIQRLDSRVFRGTSGIGPAFSIVEAFSNAGLPGEEALKQTLFMCAWDFVAPENSRLKVYVYVPRTSLRVLKAVFTQGGRLSGASVDAGCALLDELFPLLFGVEGEVDEDAEVKRLTDEGTEPVLAYLELKPGKALPSPKLYLTVGAFGSSDDVVATRIASWYKARGWTLGETWEEDLKELFKYRDTGKSSNVQPFFAISPGEDGRLKTALYLNPQIYSSLQAHYKGGLRTC